MAAGRHRENSILQCVSKALKPAELTSSYAAPAFLYLFYYYDTSQRRTLAALVAATWRLTPGSNTTNPLAVGCHG